MAGGRVLLGGRRARPAHDDHQGRLPELGQRIEFFPPHCDPTINLYDQIHAMRGDKVEAVWEIAGRGRGQ